MENKKEEYNSEGYTRFDGYFTPDYIDDINLIIDRLQEELAVGDSVFDESKSGKIKQIQYLYKHDPLLHDMLDRVTEIAEKMLNIKKTDMDVLNMQLFEKHPGISKPTRSHQDNAYFKVKPVTPITFWISLDEIDEENGCLYYAPKTHLTPTRKHQRYHKHTTFRIRSGIPGLSLCLHEHPEETDTAMITKPGDILVHNCNLVHRAGKNNSENRRRRAIAIEFIPKSCESDPLLMKYHNERLKEDIMLQKYKDPKLFSELLQEFSYLF